MYRGWSSAVSIVFVFFNFKLYSIVIGIRSGHVLTFGSWWLQNVGLASEPLSRIFFRHSVGTQCPHCSLFYVDCILVALQGWLTRLSIIFSLIVVLILVKVNLSLNDCSPCLVIWMANIVVSHQI